jgi:hypothetical protein
MLPSPFDASCATLAPLLSGGDSMLLTIHSATDAPNRWLRAAAIICRAAFGLVVHCVAHPCQPAAINRATGKVMAR